MFIFQINQHFEPFIDPMVTALSLYLFRKFLDVVFLGFRDCRTLERKQMFQT